MMADRRQFLGGAAAGLAVLAMPASLSTAFATTPPPRPQDIQILLDALQLHPGLTRYLSGRDATQLLDHMGAEWAGQDRRTRFLALARYLARIRCGHSYPNFFNQRQSVQEELFGDLPRVPFTFRWIGDQMVVTGEGSGVSGLPRGSVITRLNGRRPRDILRTLLPLVRADGGNDGKRRALLEMRGDSTFETFDVYHGLVFGGTDREAISVAARLPDGRAIRRELPSATLASRVASVSAAPQNNGPVWQWDERADGVALLTMSNWGLYNSNWDWRSWLDERLSSLPRGGKLLVDLRDNEGGLDCGDAILARLTDRDLNFAAYERRVRFRSTPTMLNPYLDTWDDSFRTLGEGAEDIGGGFYRLPAVEGQGSITARSPRIDARVAVLTSAVNSSATFQFAARCRDAGFARLFGGTTGGNRRGINGDKFFFVRLPDSELEFDLPLVGTFPAAPQPDAGIIPDVAIAATAADIAAGQDPVLTAAVDWLVRG
jgi:hypothetical protein